MVDAVGVRKPKPDVKGLQWDEQLTAARGTSKADDLKAKRNAASKASRAKKLAEAQKTIPRVDDKRGATGRQSANEAKLAAKAAAAGTVGAAIVADREPHKYLPNWKAPKTLAEAADAYYSKSKERLASQKEVDALEAQEQDLKAYLIEMLPKAKASSVGGRLARVELKVRDIPRVEDWPAFYAAIAADYAAHIKKKDGQEVTAFALLNKAASKSGIEELWNSGKAVAGVGKFPVTSLSVSKVG